MKDKIKIYRIQRNAQGHTASYWWDWAWLDATGNLKGLLSISHSDNEVLFNLLSLECVSFSKSQEKQRWSHWNCYMAMSLNFQGRKSSGFSIQQGQEGRKRTEWQDLLFRIVCPGGEKKKRKEKKGGWGVSSFKIASPLLNNPGD